MALPSTKQDYLYYVVNILAIIFSVITGVMLLYLWSVIYFHEYHLSVGYIHYLYNVLINQQYTSLTYYVIILASMVSFTIFGIIISRNPYSKTLKFSRWAKWYDVKKMKPSVIQSNGYALGVFKNKLLRTNEPLGLLCVAPAGAGKTTGTVIPTVLSCDKDCLVINDPKGELYEATYKYRNSIGKVFRIEWGQAEEEWSETTTFWNPLDLENLAKTTVDRAKYIDAITNILIKQTGGDAFWVNSGRKTLSAMMLFLIYKEELAGLSTSISQVKDKLATIGVTPDDEEEEKKGNADASQEGFKRLAKQCKHYEEEKLIPLEIITRCYNVFSELGATSPNTLGSILATISSDLSIFNNESVRKITSKNSFSMNNIRGLNNKPVSIYLISPASEQELFGVLSGIFVETAYKFITSQDLKIVKDSNIVRFILDEVAFFPKISAVIDGPAIARGYRGSFLFVCQDLGQIKEKYGENGLNTMMTNTAFKIILPQNNNETAHRLASLSGKTQKIEWVGKDKHRAKQKQEINLIEATDVMSLPEGLQIIIVQNNARTPILCKIPFFFKDKGMLKKLK
ncbi:TraG/VirD4 family protein [Candidatus Hepatincola sp. Av]